MQTRHAFPLKGAPQQWWQRYVGVIKFLSLPFQQAILPEQTAVH